jgi:hypothetical protein
VETVVQDLVERFALSPKTEEKSRALIEIAKRRALRQAAELSSFEIGVRRLAETAKDPTVQAERIIAITTLLRIGSGVRSWRDRIAEILEKALDDPLPSLELISNPDDRLHAAGVWRFVERGWISDFLAVGAVTEDSGERIRMVCVEGLLHLSPDLTKVFDKLIVPITQLRFETRKPGDSMGRRLKRLLQALQKNYSARPIEPGVNSGENLKRLAVAAFQNSGLPESQKTRIEVSEELITLVHELVRGKFSLATQSATYRVLEIVRGWFKESEWRSITERSTSSKLVKADVAEALGLLVRAGVSDEALYKMLGIASGSSDDAREWSRQFVQENPGLPEHLIGWLLDSPTRKKSALASESQQIATDEVIADLLIDFDRLQKVAESFRIEVVPEVAVIAPRLSKQVTTLLDLLSSTTNVVRVLAAKRSLVIGAGAGEIVEFSPLHHEMIDGPQPGVRFVRIVRPAVETLRSDGGRRVTKKAAVEPSRQ